MRSIYLDHAATTPMRPEVIEAMTPYFSELFANPSSLHMAGQRARRALDRARETVASCIGATPEEIIFTSGGTESDNLGLKSSAQTRSGTHIVVSAIEHRAVLSACQALAASGVSITCVPVTAAGVVDMKALAEALRPETTLVSVMMGNNETGVIQPIREISALLRPRGIPLHTDAVQALGKVPIDVNKLGATYLSISAHKINGPKGVGALYARKGAPLAPQQHGGHQERGRRGGTENVAGIVGFARAAELACAEMTEASGTSATFRVLLERALLESFRGVRINGGASSRLPHILNATFDGTEADALLLALDSCGISVSTGSACMAGAAEGSHVLHAMGLSPVEARASIRFSFGRGNSVHDVDDTMSALRNILPSLRAASMRAGR